MSKASVVAHYLNELRNVNLSGAATRQDWESIVHDYLWEDSDDDLSDHDSSEPPESEHCSGEVPADSPEVATFVSDRLGERGHVPDENAPVNIPST